MLGPAVLGDLSVARRSAASETFIDVLLSLGANQTLLSAAEGEGAPPTEGVPDEDGDATILGEMIPIVNRDDLAPIGEMEYVTQSDNAAERWARHATGGLIAARLKALEGTSITEVVSAFAGRVGEFVARATDRDGHTSAEGSVGGRVIESWTGRVVELGGDTVWARLRNDEDGLDEDVELLRSDFTNEQFAHLVVGTALVWHHEAWSEQDGSRVSRSRVEIVPPREHDKKAGEEFAAAWRELSGSSA